MPLSPLSPAGGHAPNASRRSLVHLRCQDYIDLCLTLSLMVGALYLCAWALRYKQYAIPTTVRP